MVMSNELDILIVGFNQERFTPEIRTAFRHWQVYSVAAPHALLGRRFRRAYYTDSATRQIGWERIYEVLRAAEARGSEFLPFRDWQPDFDVQSFKDAMLLRDLRRSRHSESV